MSSGHFFTKPRGENNNSWMRGNTWLIKFSQVVLIKPIVVYLAIELIPIQFDEMAYLYWEGPNIACRHERTHSRW